MVQIRIPDLADQFTRSFPRGGAADAYYASVERNLDGPAEEFGEIRDRGVRTFIAQQRAAQLILVRACCDIPAGGYCFSPMFHLALSS